MLEQVDERYQDLYLFYELSKYAVNMQNYVESEQSESGYYNQPLETSARKYAESGVPEYFQRIDEYNSKTEWYSILHEIQPNISKSSDKFSLYVYDECWCLY